ncbi:3-hydroxyacyl-CoA dehydrogenase family protein [Intestinimonas butyriciproducens]|uniref:3-hydroxyacyl-CoA dehydrogenase family protein n=1 Tax=Intestinimonas butyriciproducens TaxID=1297617 RepID=UPI00344F20F8
MGAGTMGPGIAQALATGGYVVSIWDPVAEARERGKSRLSDGVETFVRNGTLDQEQAEEIKQRVTFATSLEESVAQAGMIIEAIVENVEIKKTFYRELSKQIDKNAIVASNTSALNIFEIVPEEMLPQQLIMHWYGPAQLVPLVEVIKSEQAPQAYADTAMEVLRRCGKAPVLMKKFIQGYIVNRLQQCLNREVFYLLDNDICTAADIDYAAKISFIPRAMVLGLCKKIDFGGVDMTIKNYKNHSYTLPPDTGLPATLQRMDAEKAYGIKSGRGFYNYEGLDVEALLEKRDAQLAEAYQLAIKFINDSV